MASHRYIVESIPGPRSDYAVVSISDPGAIEIKVAGQTGRSLDGSMPASAEAQTRAALDRIATALEAHDADPDDIAHLRAFLVNREAIDGFKRARADVFQAWYGSKTPPTATTVIVAGLVDPDAVVEIEAEVWI